jgi:hypothetical protein
VAQNDAKGQKAKFLNNQRTSASALKEDVSRFYEYTPLMIEGVSLPPPPPISGIAIERRTPPPRHQIA